MAVSESEQFYAAQLAYIDLDAAVKDLSKGQTDCSITVADAIAWCDKSDYDISKIGDYLNDDGTLSEPYANWTIEAIVNENPVGGSGLWACILDTGSDSILACRGSETSQLLEKDITQDWIGADLALLFSTETAQEADLKAFMEENA